MKIDDNNLTRLIHLLSSRDKCIEYLEYIRWGGKVVSPFDATSKVYKCKNHRYYCVNSNRYFNVKTKSPMAHSKIPIETWIFAMWLFISHKRGLSSYQMAEYIGVTQKTAWKMLRAFRAMMKESNEFSLEGEIEVDETFVGGKNKNRHKNKKVAKCQGRSFKDKVPVYGMYQRDGFLVAKVVPNTEAQTLLPYTLKYVKEKSTIYTDGYEYGAMKEKYYTHSTNHGKHFYGYVYFLDDDEVVKVHSNSIEGAWSHLKRMIIGTYYKTSKKYLQTYVDEFAFKFNTRKISGYNRFELFLQSMYNSPNVA